MNYPRRSLYEILRTTAIEVPDAIATVFLCATLTYTEIKRQADRVAAALHNLDVKKGDRIGVMLPNCPQYTIAAFAVLRLGVVVVNINPLYTPRELAVVANDAGIRLLIALDLLADIALGVQNQTPIKTQLAIYKVPGIVEIRASLPKTAIGKILRRVLREEAQLK